MCSPSAHLFGAATGRRFLVHNGGFIDLGNSGASATYFPGDVGGETFRYGVYDYTTPGPLTLGGSIAVNGAPLTSPFQFLVGTDLGIRSTSPAADTVGIDATNAAQSAFKALKLSGSTVDLAPSGTSKLQANSTGVALSAKLGINGAPLTNAIQWLTAADRGVRCTDNGSATKIDATNAAQNAFQPLIISGSTLDLYAGGAQNLTCATARTTMALPIKLKSYTVATLPSGQAGDTAYASDLRVFDVVGTQESAGAGTGGVVCHNGSNWKVAGTNVTAVA